MAKRYYVGESTTVDQGVFAGKDFRECEVIGVAFMRRKFSGKPDKDYRRTTLGKYVNHEAHPNMVVTQRGQRGRGSLSFVASKNIRKGAELTVSYRMIGFEGKTDFE